MTVTMLPALRVLSDEFREALADRKKRLAEVETTPVDVLAVAARLTTHPATLAA